jgi:hypothetical protein
VLFAGKNDGKRFLPDPFDFILGIAEIRNIVERVTGYDTVRAIRRAFCQIHGHGPTLGGEGMSNIIFRKSCIAGDGWLCLGSDRIKVSREDERQNGCCCCFYKISAAWCHFFTSPGTT